VPTLDTQNSKGFCNIAQGSVTFTGTTAIGTTVTAVSSFVGLYPGAKITGAGIPANTTIVSTNPGAATLVLSQAATAAATVPLAAGSGYVLTLGTQYATRLDTYAKLLGFDYANDLTALMGGAGVGPSTPAAPIVFITNNQVKVSGQASIAFQTGTLSGSTFTASTPASGEGMYFRIMLGNSTSV
jgi:hypothetical protein